MAKRSSRSREEDLGRTRTAISVAEPLTRARASSHEEFEEPTTDPGQPSASGMTQYASRSVLVAESLQRDFEGKRYGGRPGRVVRVAEPDGPSTDGGLKARQAISLIPARGEGPAIHAGWMDAARMVAQLKSWESVQRKYLARFGQAPDIPQAAYETFLMELRRSLLSYELDVQIVVPDDDPAPAQSKTQPVGVRLELAAGIGVGAFLVGLIAGMLIG